MMFQTIMFGLTMEGTSIQNIVLILLIVGVAVYGYLEIKRLKVSVANLEKIVNDRKVPYAPPIKNPPVVPKLPPQMGPMPPQMGPIPQKMGPIPQKMGPIPQKMVYVSRGIPEKTLEPTEPRKQTSDSGHKEPELSDLMFSDEEYDRDDLPYSHDTDIPEKVTRDEKTNVTEDVHRISVLDETIEPGKPVPDAEDIKIIQAEAEDPEYSSKTVSELKAILTEMNQPVSGNKSKLIKRIREHTIVNKV
jgi:hypothetical protein